jgi:Ca2+-binding EF-hand superfamily protein
LGFDISFEAADADENGKIYEDEVLAFVEIRQSVMRSQIRARAADQEDALFTYLDADGDGRLTAREIYGAPDALLRLDANQDGRVQSQEIPGSIAVGFVRGNAQNNNLFVTPALPVANKEAPSWFRGMDTNGDGVISPREFLGSRQKFQDLDHDDDGFIGLAEIAELGQESPTEN